MLPPLPQVHAICQAPEDVLGTDDPLLMMDDENEKHQPFILVQKTQNISNCVRRPKIGEVREGIPPSLLDF